MSDEVSTEGEKAGSRLLFLQEAEIITLLLVPTLVPYFRSRLFPIWEKPIQKAGRLTRFSIGGFGSTQVCCLLEVLTQDSGKLGSTKIA